MSFAHLRKMAPAQRMEILRATVLPGSRDHFFRQLYPGELTRLFAGIAHEQVARWMNAQKPSDREAWIAYERRTKLFGIREQAVIDTVRPAVDAHTYELDDLLRIPRLLGDPVESEGVRIYWNREALGDDGFMFEKVVPLDRLLEHVRKQQAWGAAGFIALHELAYGDARVNGNVRHPRVVVADFDEKHGQTPPWDELVKVQPDIIVRSGGGWHAYWVLHESDRRALTLEYVQQVTRALAVFLGSDTSVALSTQIFRLPLLHLKDPANVRPVRIVADLDAPPREGVVQTLVDTFALVVAEEEPEGVLYTSSVLTDVGPEDHDALALVLERIADAGLLPQRDRQGWSFHCPIHEVSRSFDGDADEGESRTFIPRRNANPSAFLRVREDRSLWLCCGSVCRGAGVQQRILDALELDRAILYAEVPGGGGYLSTEHGKAFRARMMKLGQWRGHLPSAGTARAVSTPVSDDEATDNFLQGLYR